MDNITKALLRTPSPPCLLRTHGLGQDLCHGPSLATRRAQRDVLWFWFVPFVTLVGQTLDSLLQHASGLSPVLFSQGAIRTWVRARCSFPPHKAWRAPNGAPKATTPMPTTMCAPWLPWWRARAKGLQIGLVVDEAHIGLDKSTEFGKFAHWLQADYLLMARHAQGPAADRLPGPCRLQRAGALLGQPG
jgi:hypothetical protein